MRRDHRTAPPASTTRAEPAVRVTKRGHASAHAPAPVVVPKHIGDAAAHARAVDHEERPGQLRGAHHLGHVVHDGRVRRVGIPPADEARTILVHDGARLHLVGVVAAGSLTVEALDALHDDARAEVARLPAVELEGEVGFQCDAPARSRRAQVRDPVYPTP